jgi:hypothetical protein
VSTQPVEWSGSEDLAAIERKQEALLALVDELVRTPDAERQRALVEQISARTDDLTRDCQAAEARAREIARELRGSLEVVLTEAQRAEVKRATGVDMTSVTIRDDSGGLSVAMPNMTREQVFSFALAEAERQHREVEAREAARVEFERIAGELRRDAPSQVRQEIDRLLQDPEFRKAFEPAGR